MGLFSKTTPKNSTSSNHNNTTTPTTTTATSTTGTTANVVNSGGGSTTDAAIVSSTTSTTPLTNIDDNHDDDDDQSPNNDNNNNNNNNNSDSPSPRVNGNSDDSEENDNDNQTIMINNENDHTSNDILSAETATTTFTNTVTTATTATTTTTTNNNTSTSTTSKSTHRFKLKSIFSKKNHLRALVHKNKNNQQQQQQANDATKNETESENMTSYSEASSSMDCYSPPILPGDLKTVTYTIRDKGEYTYTGSLLNQLGNFLEVPHGSGSLIYPNGTVYDGDFEHGKRHGFGKLIYNSRNNNNQSWMVIGEWMDDKPNAQTRFKVSMGKNWNYWGYIELRPRADIVLLDWNDFHMCREGELYSRDTYFGGFLANKKHGYGVQVFSNMNRYFGGWKDGLFHGHGVYIYSDGAIYEGKFSKGERKGKGTMYWPNGDAMYGRWHGTDVEKGTFTKGSVKNCFATALFQIKCESSSALKEQIANGVASKSIEQYGIRRDEDNGPKLSYALKWKQFRIVNEYLRRDELNSHMEILCKSLSDNSQFDELVHKILSNRAENSYIGNAFDFFQSSFQGSYHSAAKRRGNQKSVMLYYAIEDIQSFIAFIKEEVWSYFDAAFMVLSDRSMNAEKRSRRATVVSRSKKDDPGTESFMFEEQIVDIRNMCQEEYEPLIPAYVHLKFGDTLFSLYEKTYQEKDLLLNHKLESLDFCTPEHLGVNKEFLPLDVTEKPFESSVRLLEDMSKAKTFSKKIDMLAVFRDRVLVEVKQNRSNNRKKKREIQGRSSAEEDTKDDEWRAGADDTAPVLSYLFIKANIRNHNAQFKYMNDWKAPDVQLSPVSHILAFYEGFLSFISDLDPSLKTNDGVFISNYTIYKGLERGLEKEVFNGNNDVHSFSWLPSLLIFVSLEVGRRSGEALTRLHVPSRGHMRLGASLLQNIDSVQRVLSYSKLLGFTVSLENGEVYVDFENIYPTVLYSEISVQMTKFIHFELDS